MVTRYATIDSNGRVTGFYSDDALAEIPPGALEISEEVWRRWIEDTSAQRWDGTDLVACERAVAPMTAARVRRRRAALLGASDWTQNSDVSMEPEKRAAWVAYRAALRDVPAQPGFPADVVWPEPPASTSVEG